MTDREKLARQWAEETRDNFMASNELEEAAVEHILATTTPQTMADVEWDDEKHHLAGAVFQNVGTTAEVVMFHKDGTGAIFAVDVEDGRPFIGDASKYTPNGKRYELREVGKPGHPEVLTTVEDYENAPEGTIVSGYSRSVSYKINHRRWEESGLLGQFTGDEMAGHARDVLRWGPGDEA